MILQAKSVRVATIWGFCARYLSHSFVLFISTLFWAYPWRHAKYGVQIYWEIVENWGIHIRFSISCESDSLSAFTCGTVFRSMAFCIFFSEQVWLAKPFALHLQTDIMAARMVRAIAMWLNALAPASAQKLGCNLCDILPWRKFYFYFWLQLFQLQ